MSERIQHVVERWRTLQADEDDPEVIGIERDGVSSTVLDMFERAHGLDLPASFRALWLLSDGTAMMDGNQFIFWPLDNIDEEMKRFAGFERSDPNLRWATFADFQLCTRVFLLRFERHVSVWAHDAVEKRPFPESAEPIAESFDAFISLYLDEPTRLTRRPTPR